MMRAFRITVVLAVLAIAASAYCQNMTTGIFSARQLGMGGAGIAVADDAYAWAQNPAGLPNVKSPGNRGSWGFNLAGGLSFSSRFQDEDSFNLWNLSVSGVDPTRTWGIGGGWGHEGEEGWGNSTGYGVGIGTRIKSEDHPFNVGVSLFHVEQPRYGYVMPAAATYMRLPNETDNMFNVGFMYDIKIPDSHPIRLGLVIQDVTDQIQRSWNVGASYRAGRHFLIAADLDSVASNNNWGAGAEYSFADDWCLRAGDHDGAFTYGAGYHHGNIYVDFGRDQKNDEETNMITAGFTF
jgi:hypothetical protein